MLSFSFICQFGLKKPKYYNFPDEALMDVFIETLSESAAFKRLSFYFNIWTVFPEWLSNVRLHTLIIKMNKTNTETKDFPTRKTQMKEENSLWKLSETTLT